MTRLRRFGLAATAALALVLTGSVAEAIAQEMASGTWAATITGPTGESFDVTLEVDAGADALAIMLVPPAEAGVDSFQLEEVALGDGALTFVIPFPGVRVSCELARDEGGAYEGDCTGDDGNTGHLRMVAPESLSEASR